MTTKRDWKGNQHAAFIHNGDVGHSDEERADNDYYATDPTAIDDLLGVELISKAPILEPACGQGHLSRRLIDYGYKVYSYDLIERGYGTPGVDFLTLRKLPEPCHIITNPPYTYALEFAKKGLALLQPGYKLAMFLKLTFLEGNTRVQFFKEHPIKTVHVYSYRKTCGKNGDFTSKWGSAICYAWFIWEAGYTGETTLKWISREQSNNYTLWKKQLDNAVVGVMI